MPFTSDQQLAVRIVEPYASKSLTKRAAADLAKSIATALYLRSKATLTYGPQEVARIAGRENLPAAKIEDILWALGGECVSADRVDSAWEALDSLGPVDLLGEARGRIASEIKLLLHASRDSLRNHGVDTTTQSFSLTNDGGYSAEAFGLVRALHLLGFGSLSGDSEGDVSATNLQAWYSNIQQQVLREENFNGSNVCEYCLSRYGKDANGKVDAASLDAAREAFREIRAAITQGPHA